jgi:hypothetical protein
MPEVRCEAEDCYFNRSRICECPKVTINDDSTCNMYEPPRAETSLERDCREYHRRVDAELEGGIRGAKTHYRRSKGNH